MAEISRKDIKQFNDALYGISVLTVIIYLFFSLWAFEGNYLAFLYVSAIFFFSFLICTLTAFRKIILINIKKKE